MHRTTTQITLAALDFLQSPTAPSSMTRWVMWPEGHRLGRAEVCGALDAMSKPVIVSVHVEPGSITAVPLDATAPEARQWLEHEWRNQNDYMKEKLAVVSPNPDAVDVLLELEGRDLIFSTLDLRAWARDYVVTSCGWTLGDSGGDTRAPLRLLLRRPDGKWSPGMARHRGTQDT